MRLICPNCGAQYEVDTGLIPETGRDVQCSNCGHGWFQHPEDLVTDEAADALAEEAAEQAEQDNARRRRELDPDVADVLREEAEREAAARKAEAGDGLESQPDLGLDDGDGTSTERTAAARARMDRLRGLENPPKTSAVEDFASRKKLLPDVDEINSTLRSDEARGETPVLDDLGPVPRRRRGFRTGFFLVLLVCIIAVGVYALAPTIARTVPQAEPYLASYVEAVNGLRTQVNGWVETGVARVRDLIGGG